LPDTFDLNDAPNLNCAFSVSGIATDPTTVTLAVTDPDQTISTYTYAGGTITRSSVGVFTKQITLTKRGVWAYVWTGSGACIASATGTVTVRY
jgi:hypothetical protein